jgi:hypothetical protein
MKMRIGREASTTMRELSMMTPLTKTRATSNEVIQYQALLVD